MSITATLVYTAFLGGGSAVNVAFLMDDDQVPVPPDVLAAFGLRVDTDVTPVASPVVRTIVLDLGPSATATATASLENVGDSGSPVGAVAVTGAGQDYILPPFVQFSAGRSLTPPDTEISQLAGSLDSPAMAQAYLEAVLVSFAAGAGYSAATFIKVSGGLKPGGTPMVLTPTIVGGHITAVAITNPGDGYTGVPTVIVVDPSVTPGSGGSVFVSMGVGRIDVLRGGGGYTEAPTVTLVPAFISMFPDGTDQAAPLEQLMTTALQQSTLGPVTASPVAIA